MKDSYLTISKPSRGLYKEKGSKFISLAYPVNSEFEINTIIKAVRKEYHDARHHCFAWKLYGPSPLFRASDDGEPSGTAGKPILGQINSKNVFQVLLIVARYFGGVLLGTGGLAHAYKEAAANALDNAVIIENIITDTFSVQFKYNDLNLFNKIIQDFNAEPFDQQYEMECSCKLRVRKSLSEKFINTLTINMSDKYIINNNDEAVS